MILWVAGVVRALIPVLGLAMPSVLAGAQDPIRYEIHPQFATPRPDSPDRPDVMFRVAEARISTGSFDAVAESLLHGTERYTKHAFNLPSLEFRRAATERVTSGAQRGDVLIAEWTFQEAFGKGSIILTDTPYYSRFALRVNECQIHTQVELTTFLKAALNCPCWALSSPQGNLGTDATLKMGGITTGPPFTILLPAGTPPITFFWGSRTPSSPYNFIADFEFSAVFEGGQWFLDFAVGKSGTEKFYGVPPWVPERFPPLSELVKSWSFEQIRAEVGKEVKPWVGVQAFTEKRDEILITELARRGMSQDQVIDLLRDTQPTAEGYSSRLGAVGYGFKNAGKGPFEKLFFEPALETYERIGPVADKSVWALFGDAAIQGCASDIEARALGMLMKGTFVSGPLAYLSECSSSPDALTVVEAVSVASGTPDRGLKRAKELAIRQIRNRVASSSKPVERNQD